MIDWIVTLLWPIVGWWAKLHWPWTHKLITGDQYYLWRDLIQPGDILLTTTRGEWSNSINPSDIKHGGIYVGGKDIKYVVEAVGKGVIKTNLVKFMTTKDIFIIVRPKFANKIRRAEAGKKSLEHVGLPYDKLFKKGNKALYCFENAICAYVEMFPDTKFKCKEILGRRVWVADTFMNDPENWEIYLDSRKELKR